MKNKTLPFGKYKYKPIPTIPHSYLKWILEKRILEDRNELDLLDRVRRELYPSKFEAEEENMIKF